ncbi:MAG: hypothetical protein DRG83_04400 [Deltaproteobacteria bacterium]|nr:MAG: hypothetical protein DRG83_04400 [Deltaproteobacteria bacterium]
MIKRGVRRDMMEENQVIRWVKDVRKTDLELFGKKCANLGELYGGGFPVPFGFVIGLAAYERFLKETGARDELSTYFSTFKADPNSPQDISKFEEAERFARGLVESKKMPAELEELVMKYYSDLCRSLNKEEVWVSVRSSGPISRPGQYETYLFVRGEAEVLKHIVKVWSSTFNTRSLVARARAGLPLDYDPVGVAVIEMVDAKSAGVAFSFEPGSFSLLTMAIEGCWGLGEGVVSGRVSVDRWFVDRRTLTPVRRQIPRKTEEFVIEDPEKGGATFKLVPPERQKIPCLTEQEVKALAELTLKVEKHFGQPQDVEWAIRKDLEPPESLVLLQARPQKISKGKFGLM